MSEEIERYRINGNKVESFYKGEWVWAYSCKDSEAAEKCLIRCLARAKEWALLTDEEKHAKILRARA